MNGELRVITGKRGREDVWKERKAQGFVAVA
jgi:hypothetical protein